MKFPKRTKAYKEALSEHGEPFAVAYENFRDIEEAIEAVKENYRGSFRNLEAYAEEVLESEVKGISAHIVRYINYSAYGRDLESGGEIWTAESEEGGIHVFSN